MMGSQGATSMLGPEQQQALSKAFGGGGAYEQFLQPQNYEEMFQKSVIDPAMQAHMQQEIPGLQQRFVDVGAGSSSALNQALSQSATDLSTSLGSKYMDFFQGQQGRTLEALGQIGSQTQQPFQQGGIMGALLQMLGDLGGAAIGLSSATVKENIRDYNDGLEKLNKLDVKMYDYKEEYGGLKNTVGVIAEDVPEEFQAEIEGVKGVNFYGLIGLLINAVKELSEKVTVLEAV